MVIHQGYCRPLKKKVDFPVDSVEALSTKKGEKWIVRGSYEGYKITTFVSKQKGEELLSSINHQEIEEVEVFGAEIAHIPAEEVEVFDAEEIVLEAPKIEHDMLEAKHYRKDGTLDMRYKICREVARSKDAETLEDYTPEELATSNVNVGDITVDAGKGGYGAEEDEQEDDEIDDIVTDVAIDSMFDAEAMSCPPATQDVAINTKNRNLTIEKFGYGPLNVDEPGDFWEKIAEQWNTTVKAAKKSKCGNCVAFDESPRMKDCMPGETSDGEGTLGYCWMHHFKCHSARTCDTWAKGGPITTDAISHEWQEKAFGKSKASDMATSATKTKVAAAETKSKTSSADPDLIIFEEHIPPEVWNNMSSSEKGKYISTRDETLLIAPCCGVSKAELRKDVDANYECTSCCFSGDDFHPRWWASEPAPSVRTTMDAEDFMDDSLNPNTAVVPNQVYYSMMMNLPDGVSVTQTEDGTSMILGFHNQNAARVQGLIEIYSPREDDGSEGDTLVSQEPVSFVPTVHFPEAKMNDFDAEAFSEAMSAEGIADDIYDTKEEAMERAQELGSNKTHSHKINGDTVHMPFKDHETYQKEMGAEGYDYDYEDEGGYYGNAELDKFVKDYYGEDFNWVLLGQHQDYNIHTILPNFIVFDDDKNEHKGIAIVFDAESFDVEFEEWGKQEMKTHGKDISFNDWLMEEAKSHGDMPLVEWAKDEEKSHDERYGAEESFEADYNDRGEKLCPRCRLSGYERPIYADGLCVPCIEELEDEQDEFSKRYEAESDRPLNKTVIGLLGIGALGAILAPKQIKALFDKLK